MNDFPEVFCASHCISRTDKLKSHWQCDLWFRMTQHFETSVALDLIYTKDFNSDALHFRSCQENNNKQVSLLLDSADCCLTQACICCTKVHSFGMRLLLNSFAEWFNLFICTSEQMFVLYILNGNLSVEKTLLVLVLKISDHLRELTLCSKRSRLTWPGATSRALCRDAK